MEISQKVSRGRMTKNKSKKLTVNDIRKIIIKHIGINDDVYPLNDIMISSRYYLSAWSIHNPVTRIYINTKELARSIDRARRRKED